LPIGAQRKDPVATPAKRKTRLIGTAT